MKFLKYLFGILLVILLSSNLMQAQRESREKTQSFNVSPSGSLIVNIDPGDIIITVWDKNEVLVKVKGLEDDGEEDLSISERNNKVYVEFESNWGWSDDAKFYITIPEQFNVDLQTTGGDIDLKDNIVGSFDADTRGGDIEFMDVNGEVNVSTSGGDIECGDINGRLRLNTQGGDIKVGAVTGGSARVSTMGGDIRIDDVSSDLDVKTYGGDINVGNIGGNASVVTYGGDIKLKEVSGSVEMSTYGGNLTLRKANGHVKASTYGGNITLDNITGTVDAKTSSGRIKVDLNPSGEGRSRMKTSSGEIFLSLPANAKVTIEAEIEIDGYRERRREYKISSDFEATSYVGDDDTVYAIYELNGGGEKIKLETVNSNIIIRKKSN